MVGIKESATFNSTIVIVKVAVVLFVILLGMRYINPANWGARLALVRADGFFGDWGGRGVHFLRVHWI